MRSWTRVSGVDGGGDLAWASRRMVLTSGLFPFASGCSPQARTPTARSIGRRPTTSTSGRPRSGTGSTGGSRHSTRRTWTLRSPPRTASRSARRADTSRWTTLRRRISGATSTPSGPTWTLFSCCLGAAPRFRGWRLSSKKIPDRSFPAPRGIKAKEQEAAKPAGQPSDDVEGHADHVEDAEDVESQEPGDVVDIPAAGPVGVPAAVPVGVPAAVPVGVPAAVPVGVPAAVPVDASREVEPSADTAGKGKAAVSPAARGVPKEEGGATPRKGAM